MTLPPEALAESIRAATGAEALAFFDAIAPIVYTESIDMSVAWLQSRYDKGETEDEQKAYINCPMTREQYEAFIDALLVAEKTEFQELAEPLTAEIRRSLEVWSRELRLDHAKLPLPRAQRRAPTGPLLRGTPSR